jgi:hypothetical protein
MRIREQVHDDLLEAAPVTGVWQRLRQIDFQDLSFLPHERVDRRHCIRHNAAQVQRFELEPERAGFELVIGQQVVDMDAEAFDIAPDVRQQLLLVRMETVRQTRLCQAQPGSRRRQRGLEVVRNGRDERPADPVELLQALGFIAHRARSCLLHCQAPSQDRRADT